jgi:hypothetical protein
VADTQDAPTGSQYCPVSPPIASATNPQATFQYTLLNVRNTCFFNSVLQVIASLSTFVQAIVAEPLTPRGQLCLAFLKLFIPAIAVPSSEPNKLLDVSSVRQGDWIMTLEDWKDFVLLLTTMFDAKYAIGAFADPGDLLDYFLSIVSGAGQMCAIDFAWATSFSCGCRQKHKREQLVSEQALTVTLNFPILFTRPSPLNRSVASAATNAKPCLARHVQQRGNIPSVPSPASSESISLHL